MIAVAFVLIGVVGLVIGVVAIQFAVADQARMALDLRAELAEIEAACEADAQASAVAALPSMPVEVLSGEVLDDTHDSGWEPITPDLIA